MKMDSSDALAIFLFLLSTSFVSCIPVQDILSMQLGGTGRRIILNEEEFTQIKLSDACNKDDIDILPYDDDLVESIRHCSHDQIFCRTIVKGGDFADYVNSCAPTNCSETDVDLIVGNDIKQGLTVPYFLNEANKYSIATHCDQTLPRTKWFWITVMVYAFLAFTVAVGSLTGLYSSVRRLMEQFKDSNTGGGFVRMWLTPNPKSRRDSKGMKIPNIIVTSPGQNACSSCIDASSRRIGATFEDSKKSKVSLSPIPFPNLHSGGQRIGRKQSDTLLRKSCSFKDSHSSSDLSALEQSLRFSNPSIFVSSIKSVDLEDSGQLGDNNNIVLTTTSENLHIFLRALIMTSVQKSLRKFKKKKPQNMKEDIILEPVKFRHSLLVLALWGVLYSQTASFYATSPNLENKQDLEKYFRSPVFQFAINGSSNLHTLFFISGLACTHGILTLLRKRKQDSQPPLSTLLILILSRLLKLLPLYVVVMMFWVNIAPRMGSGALWYSIHSGESCAVMSWQNFIYVNNLLSSPTKCMPWTWIIACNMQLYISGTLIIYLAKRFPSRVWFVSSLVLGISISTALAFHGKIAAASIAEFWYSKPSNMSLPDYIYHSTGGKSVTFDLLISKPYYHLVAYATGSHMGKVFFYKENINTLPMIVFTLASTLISLPAFKFILMSTYLCFEPESVLGTTKWHWLFVNIMDKLWVLCLIPLTLYLNYTRYKGFVCMLLLANTWKSLSRMNTGVILTHPIVVMMMLYSSHHHIHFDMWNLTSFFMLSLMLTYILCLFFLLFGQLPINQLAKFIMYIWNSSRYQTSYNQMKNPKTSVAGVNSPNHWPK